MIPIGDNPKKDIDPLYRRQYHEGDIQYRLRSENRSRLKVWLLPLISLFLLSLSVTLNPDDNGIVITCIISISMIFSTYAKVAQNQLFWDVRDFQDIRDTLHQASLKRAYEIGSYLPVESSKPEIMPEIVDPVSYLDSVAQNWRTHLGVLSPTDTGKTTTVEYFLQLYTQYKKVLFIAIEPKDNKWESLPYENVIRIKICPTRSDFVKMMIIFDWILEIAEHRKIGAIPIDFEIVLNLEEYLTIYKQIKVNLGTKEGNLFSAKVKAIQNVGRSLGVHIILLSQSPVADDLGMSGGERSNMRLVILGSKGGGFDAIDRNMTNNQLIVGRESQEQIKAQYNYWKPRLKGRYHPMVMCNFHGDWVLFNMPFLKDQKLEVNSLKLSDFSELDQALRNPSFSQASSVTLEKTETKKELDFSKIDRSFLDDIFN